MIKSEFDFPELKLVRGKYDIRNYYNYLKFRSFARRTRLNETWIIVGAGPSSSKALKEPKFIKLMEQYPVIGLKQAGAILPELVNIQIYNEIRFNKSYSEIGNLRFSVSQYERDYKSHIHFPILRYKVNKALFRTNDYHKWELKRRFFRPWGVGVFFELAIFIPVLFGAKRIIVTGIDMNPVGKFHFYDKDDAEDSERYGVDSFEFPYSRGSSVYLNYWLKKRGCDIMSYSDISNLDFPKIYSLDKI